MPPIPSKEDRIIALLKQIIKMLEEIQLAQTRPVQPQ